MCDADLELDIRIKEIARRLADLAGNALWRAQLRYMSLLQRPAMSPENNPVGPEAISSGLWALCNASGAALDRQMELLDRLEQLLASELPAVYDELNDLLASRNVEPAQSTITQSPGPRVGSSPAGGSSQAGSGGTGGGDPFAALQQVLSAQFGGIAAGATGGAAGGDGEALRRRGEVMRGQRTTRAREHVVHREAESGSLYGMVSAMGLPRSLRARRCSLS